jgi:sec-independent protein translocase protein TatA
MTVIPTPLLVVFGLGGPELLIIFAVLILLFGAKKLPELAKGLGRSVNEFKKASKEVETEESNEPSEADLKAQLAAAKAELAAAKAKNSGNN